MLPVEIEGSLNLLLSLPKEHPSFLRWYKKYITYLEENCNEIGIKLSDDLGSKLRGKLFNEAKDKFMILQEALNELLFIQRTIVIKLTRLPLESYLYARKVASDFLNTIEPKDFVSDNAGDLMLDKTKCCKMLYDMFKLMQKSKDVFIYYARFRKVMITLIVNMTLKPSDVLPYRKVVEFIENKIRETDKKLSVIDKNSDLDLMDKFGNSTSSNTEGIVDSDMVLRLMDKGISYLIRLKNSGLNSDASVLNTLMNFSRPGYGEPLHDFLYGCEHGVQIIYCRTRKEIVEARKVAKSLLNIYNPDVLLKTALNTVYEVVTYKLNYDRDAVIELTKNNLNLLYENGVINEQTVRKYEEYAVKAI